MIFEEYKTKRIKKILKQQLIIFSIMFNMVLLGGIFNLTATSENSGRMPIYSIETFSDNTYFSFNNFSEIRFPYLSDIFHIKNIYFSIGDILIFSSLILTIIFEIFYIKKNLVNYYKKK